MPYTLLCLQMNFFKPPVIKTWGSLFVSDLVEGIKVLKRLLLIYVKKYICHSWSFTEDLI